MRQWIKAIPLGLGVPVVIGAATVKPEDAASNIAAWAHWLGIHDVPQWMTNPTIDGKVIAGTAMVGAVYAFLIWGVPFLRKKATEEAKPALADHLETAVEANLHDFLRYIGLDPMDRSTPSSNKAYDAFEKLRQLLRNGQIVAWGKPGFKYRNPHMSWKPREPIPPVYWRDAQIFCLDVLGAPDTAQISTMPDEAMGGKPTDAPVYKALSIIEDGMKKHFREDEFKA
jgi:hypothetical protein